MDPEDTLSAGAFAASCPSYTLATAVDADSRAAIRAMTMSDTKSCLRLQPTRKYPEEVVVAAAAVHNRNGLDACYDVPKRCFPLHNSHCLLDDSSTMNAKIARKFRADLAKESDVALNLGKLHHDSADMPEELLR
jgi:hypothetical protein